MALKPEQEQLTFVNDHTILVVSSVGLLCVGAVVLWVVRQSPDWAADEDGDGLRRPWWRRLLSGFTIRAGAGRNQAEEVEVDGPVGGRTRVNRGGREATKAARKEAKKRAKAEFKRSQEASAAQETRQRLKHERREAQDLDQAEESARRAAKESAAKQASERSAEMSQAVENHILHNKVSSVKSLATELDVPSSEVRKHIEKLEKSGKIIGVMVDGNEIDSTADNSSSYVRIGLDEMRALVSFIDQKGRVSMTELAREANKVLKLGPTAREGGEKDRKGVTAGGEVVRALAEAETAERLERGSGLLADEGTRGEEQQSIYRTESDHR